MTTYKLVLCALVLSTGTVRNALAEGHSIPVQTIVLEARGESLEGQIAVGEVIRNRAFKARSTFEAVCMRPRQFSAWNQPIKAQRTLSEVSNKTWKVAEEAWDRSGLLLETHGATHYHTTATHPYWARSKRPTVIIGRHKFYNNVD